MDRSVLADRFVNYADAVSVFPLVQGVTLTIALADPDARCSIVEIWPLMLAGNLIFSLAMTTLVIVLRRAELSLRDSQADDKAVMDKQVARYLARLQLGRFAVIWLAFFYVAINLVGATIDPACAAAV